MLNVSKVQVIKFAKRFVQKEHVRVILALIALSYTLDYFQLLPEVSMVARFIFVVIAFIGIFCHAAIFVDSKFSKAA